MAETLYPLPLPSRPNIEQYKRLAKDLQDACRLGNAAAIRDWATNWTARISRLTSPDITPEVRRQIDSKASRIEQRWQEFKKTNQRAARCVLADAQFFVAGCHGFANWPQFAQHLEAVARAGTPVSQFESAAEAIIGGDIATLNKLLHDNPELVRAHSTREHRSTLLHYVSANGVEDFRQKTPRNIVEITKMLLGAGADVNAESYAYGGRQTPLGLAATSCHPENAGVQIPLLELLIEHGAILDGPGEGSAVNGCLRNGRGPAAEFLAGRGARLDLEGAAGVGRLDLVKGFFTEDGGLKPSATQKQLIDGFAWACEFGRSGVVEFLLQKGMQADAMLNRGETGLHWASYEGHADIVKLLLQRGAQVHVIDSIHHGTALDWALHGWTNSPAKGGQPRYYEVVALLARAGARPDPRWYENIENRGGAAERLRSDAHMLAALRGEISS
jgi:ankyrin repeat protein